MKNLIRAALMVLNVAVGIPAAQASVAHHAPAAQMDPTSDWVNG